MNAIELVRDSVVAIGFIPADITGSVAQETLAEKAIGLSADHVPVIVGTGFCIADNLIITNKHIVGGVLELAKNYDYFDPDSILKYMRILRFGRVGDEQRIYKYRIKAHMFPNFDDAFPYPIDLGFMSFHEDLPEIKPLEFDERKPQIGDSVGILGFPFGGALFTHGKQIPFCFSESFQKGYISSIAYDGFGKTITSIQIDMFVSGGSSGSPVFSLDNGKVLGVLWGGPPLQGVVGHLIQASPLSWCVPADFARQMTEVFDKARGEGQRQVNMKIDGTEDGIIIRKR